MTSCFPLSMRWPLTFWRWLFAPKPAPFEAQAESDPIVARGAYFVEGLGHCGECHTPRNLAMQVKAQTPSPGICLSFGSRDRELLRAESAQRRSRIRLAIGARSDIVEFLTTGANPRGIAFGSMSDVIVHSTQYMSHEDAARDGASISRHSTRPRRATGKILRLRRNGAPRIKERRCEQARRSALS